MLVKYVVQLVFGMCTTSGLLILGKPGVGKTPFAIIMAMAFGRMHVRTRNLIRRPGWRLGKQFDVFRHKAGEVQEGIILDDVSLGKIDPEDIKSFGYAGSSGHSDARYTPAKWAKNQFKAPCNNNWNEDLEPVSSDAATRTATA